MLPCGAPGRQIVVAFIKNIVLVSMERFQNIGILVIFNEKITWILI